jgi:hypothetical protein
MAPVPEIQPHSPVIGADGVHVGTVDHIVGGRIKLTKQDSSDGRHRYIDMGLVAEVEDGTVRLSANGNVAILLEDVEPEEEAAVEARLDEALEETFPASDPVSAKHIT